MTRESIRLIALATIVSVLLEPIPTSTHLTKPSIPSFQSQQDIETQALSAPIKLAFHDIYDRLAAWLVRQTPHLQPAEGLLTGSDHRERKPNRFHEAGGWETYRPHRTLSERLRSVFLSENTVGDQDNSARESRAEAASPTIKISFVARNDYKARKQVRQEIMALVQQEDARDPEARWRSSPTWDQRAATWNELRKAPNDLGPDNHSQAFFVARDVVDNQFVGILVLTEEGFFIEGIPEDAVEWHDVIRFEFQGRSIGTQLRAFAFQWAKDNGIKKLAGAILGRNHASLNSFKKAASQLGAEPYLLFDLRVPYLAKWYMIDLEPPAAPIDTESKRHALRRAIMIGLGHDHQNAAATSWKAGYFVEAARSSLSNFATTGLEHHLRTAIAKLLKAEADLAEVYKNLKSPYWEVNPRLRANLRYYRRVMRLLLASS